ncbi:MAG: hypothetical protein HZB35_09950 [Nitrospirae bacterium]|nr:hypothetical protein [Nitrospirota bacterium]
MSADSLKTSPAWLWILVLAGLSCGALTACTAQQPRRLYQEQHEIRRLTVVFLDEQSLQAKYTAISGRPAVSLSGYPPMQSLTTVRGFYDFNTKTLYCSKMDFTVCGHELHHAVLGRFHPE